MTVRRIACACALVLATAVPTTAENRITLGACAIGPTGGGAVCMPTELDVSTIRRPGRGSLSYYGVQRSRAVSGRASTVRGEWANLGGIAMRYKRSDRNQTLDVVVLTDPFGN